jgi:hypothetical protein
MDRPYIDLKTGREGGGDDGGKEGKNDDVGIL